MKDIFLDGCFSNEITRRNFIKRSAAIGVSTFEIANISHAFASNANSVGLNANLLNSTIGYHGGQKISSSHLNLLGARVYDPRIGRFAQHDNHEMSPFGKGGVHGYAFVDGNPLNRRDPTGNFAILSVLIGAIVGAVVGSAVSAISEGVRVAVNGGSFDWKQVVIGASIGAISGGFGAASSGASAAIKSGMVIADAVTSGAAEFGINVAMGQDVKSSGLSSLTGTVIGIATFGAGIGIGKASKGLSKVQSKLSSIQRNGLSGRGAPRAASMMASATQNQGETLSTLERLVQQPTIFDALNRNLNDRSVARLRASSRQLADSFESSMNSRREALRNSLNKNIHDLEPLIAENSRLQTRLSIYISHGINVRANRRTREQLFEVFGEMSLVQKFNLVEQKNRFPNDYAATIAKYPYLPFIYVEALR